MEKLPGKPLVNCYYYQVIQGLLLCTWEFSLFGSSKFNSASTRQKIDNLQINLF